MATPFPSKWVCIECKGTEWYPDGSPCLTCRPHDCRRCQGTEQIVLGIDPSDITGGTYTVTACPDCAPTEPDRYDLPSLLLA